MGKIIDDNLVMLELGLSSSPTDEERAVVQQAVVKAEGAVVQHLRYNPLLASHTEYYPQADVVPNGAQGVWEASDTEAYYRRQTEAASDLLQLKHIPVRTSVAIDLRIEYDGRFGTKAGSFAASSQKTEGTDYWAQYASVDSSANKVCDDGILRSFGLWPTEPGSIKVVYTAGYSRAEMEGQDSVIDASPIMDAIVEESLRRAKKVFVLWKKNTRTGHNAGTITSEGLGEYNYSLSPGLLEKAMSAGGLTSDSKEKLEPFVNWGLWL